MARLNPYVAFLLSTVAMTIRVSGTPLFQVRARDHEARAMPRSSGILGTQVWVNDGSPGSMPRVRRQVEDHGMTPEQIQKIVQGHNFVRTRTGASDMRRMVC